MSSDFLLRIAEGLDQAGVRHGSRNKSVAEKTGYAIGTVNRVLSGNAALTDRFIQAVCSGFDIRKEWIERGEKPILKGFDLEGLEGLSMSPEWHKNRLERLQKEKDLLEIEIAKINAMQSDIETSFERYKDLIIEFNRLPVDEMDKAIEVLLKVQTIRKEQSK